MVLPVPGGPVSRSLRLGVRPCSAIRPAWRCSRMTRLNLIGEPALQDHLAQPGLRIGGFQEIRELTPGAPDWHGWACALAAPWLRQSWLGAVLPACRDRRLASWAATCMATEKNRPSSPSIWDLSSALICSALAMGRNPALCWGHHNRNTSITLSPRWLLTLPTIRPYQGYRFPWWQAPSRSPRTWAAFRRDADGASQPPHTVFRQPPPTPPSPAFAPARCRSRPAAGTHGPTSMVLSSCFLCCRAPATACGIFAYSSATVLGYSSRWRPSTSFPPDFDPPFSFLGQKWWPVFLDRYGGRAATSSAVR